MKGSCSDVTSDSLLKLSTKFPWNLAEYCRVYASIDLIYCRNVWKELFKYPQVLEYPTFMQTGTSMFWLVRLRDLHETREKGV